MLFAYAAVFHYDTPGLFDDKWKADGFCVANKDAPYFNSHDMCFYFDTLGALVLFAAYKMLKDYPGMSNANEHFKDQMLGVFAHGVGHFMIGKAMRDASGDEELDTVGGVAIEPTPFTIAATSIFWIGLLKSATPDLTLTSTIPFALIAAYGQSMIPPKLGFTYVQTILLLGFACNKLAWPSEKKTFEYALFPIVTALPLGAIAWAESTACSKGYEAVGGHLVYDAWIPIGILAYYVTCWTKAQKKVKTV